MAKKKKNSASPPQPLPTPPMQDQDDGLMDDLLAELESRDHNRQVASATILTEMNIEDRATELETIAAGKQDAKSRFKARQARKTAQLAQSFSPDDPVVQERLAREAKEEEDQINNVARSLGLEVYDINPDGHCLFSAIADQLALLRIIPPQDATYATIRTIAANYIHAHADDFLPFLPSAEGEDGAGALDAGMMSRVEFDNYCATMRDTATWGGEPEIVALSKAFNVPIHVVQGGNPPVVVHDPSGDSTISQAKGYAGPVLRISYHRRQFGLGEHYNSLRPIQRS